MTTTQLIQAIVAARQNSKLTQEELGRRAGLSRRTIVAIEAGDHDIGVRKLERILNALGLSLIITKERHRPTESELLDVFKDDDD